VNPGARQLARRAFAERLAQIAHHIRAPITVCLRRDHHNPGPEGASIGQGRYFVISRTVALRTMLILCACSWCAGGLARVLRQGDAELPAPALK
jgi:hypothetical protein